MELVKDKEGNKTAFNMETTFKGKNAEVFMNGQGYEFKPIQQVIYTNIPTIKTTGAPRQPKLEGRITEKSRYFKKGSYNAGYKFIERPIMNNGLLGFESIGRAKVSYTYNKTVTKYLQIMDFFYPNSHGTFNSWDEYNFNTGFINDYYKNHVNE